ncbi:phosphoribosyl-ATP pyrophosphohydrolase [Alkalihalobacillus alcalophilus ATCC 27647 = CGMCC 1.3604]|uniref:Phosphoribosyl-ATP pyrophosphohydrolase n=1 Tax=Alkalihalobacillus alcalophilus ATCC 27647 = CGMCC 1.3604 TaxID=1218173 RepID=A0A094WGF3_ALKAL|nr:nucleoside triphosphate pyrophosphohydrolase [Alkalihalobacillus alcalophilus]KGA95866.1 phosphoribosyl-ATP pyrophosphohydrolase [Alkalihalobacillus alcalophilus ATCC 27647 = CGMCC 1.3604]MED1563971.1 nucleoside triphosphate pyrophosphohydrolase [Alkalihalobacillus alcalophilus]THG92104.1 phosphoribosyl-ATP pyrophosphohydrolase [Alkalihalobacillus alcalophilus ATCC 27647 = CGMCC 1.3604]
MPIYKKLVRDQIPEIIEKTGAKYSIEMLDEELYQKELRRKLQEEIDEYMEALTDNEAVEELADVLEVIFALAKTHQTNELILETIRVDKRIKRGAFDKRIYLVEVED